MRSSDATDLPLLLEIAGARLETTESFAAKDGRVRRWKGLADDVRPGARRESRASAWITDR